MVSTMQLTHQPNVAFDETHLCDSNLDDAMLLLVQFLNQKHHNRTTTYHTSSSPHDMVSPRAKLLDKFSLQGVQYSIAERRTHDSHVLFKLPQADTSKSFAHPTPGQITHIFLHSQVRVPQEDENQFYDHSIYLCI